MATGSRSSRTRAAYQGNAALRLLHRDLRRRQPGGRYQGSGSRRIAAQRAYACVLAACSRPIVAPAAGVRGPCGIGVDAAMHNQGTKKGAHCAPLVPVGEVGQPFSSAAVGAR